jgi:uncharacterized RDD family membrane protein YckC
MLGERRFARFGARLAAGFVDWLIVLAAMWSAVIFTAILDADLSSNMSLALTYAVTLLLPVLYFGLSWARRGQTVGLRTNDLEVVSTSTGEWPSLPRALLRALATVLTFVAVLLPLVAGFADGPASRAAAMVGVGLALTLLALAGHLSALVDRRGQSLQDRVFGLAVLAERPAGRSLGSPQI